MKKSRQMVAVLSALAVMLSLSSCGVKKTQVDIKSFKTQTDNFVFTNYSGDTGNYTTPVGQEDAAFLSEYQEVCHNRFLVLYYSNATAAVAILDKRDGKVWYSNSPEIDSDETIDSDSKNLFKAQLTVEYLDGQNFKLIDSYTSSVLNNKVTSEEISDGLRVCYSFLDNKTDSDKQAEPKELFNITIEYKLEHESLIASVPMDKVKYFNNIPPLRISVLPHFGGSNMTGDGYLVVPDGSGALINFDSNKYSVASYIGNVYGFDYTLEMKNQPSKMQSVALPVFGLKEGNHSFLAIIEDGEAFSTINANRAGTYSSFHEVYASFNTFSYQNISIGALENASKLIGIQDIAYQGSLRIRYAFQQSGSNDYVGMANYYRNYLIQKDNFTPIQEGQDIPLNLELIGTIEKLKSFLGIKYMGMEQLTTTAQAQTILEQIMQNGINNINVKYSGWANGGLRQKFPSTIQAEKAIGGKKGLKTLEQFVQQKGLALYPSVDILTTPLNSKGFSKFNMAARQIDQKDAKLYFYDLVTHKGDDYNIILSPLVLDSLMNSFNKSYQKMNINRVSLNDIGSQVYADYTKGAPVDRQSTVNLYSKMLKDKLSGYQSVMLSGGFAYAVPYADVLLDVPLSGSNFDVTDSSIPFYQIVYHGLVTYSGSPLNSSYDFQDDLLKTIEYGASPYFKLMYADGAAIKNTEYSQFCSNNYEIWQKDLIKSYKDANAALSKVQRASIISHGEVASGVFKTGYSNQLSVYVNYNDKDIQVDGITVPAKGYMLNSEVKK